MDILQSVNNIKFAFNETFNRRVEAFGLRTAVLHMKNFGEASHMYH